MSTFSPQYGSTVYADIPGFYVQECSDEVPVKPRHADTPGRAGSYTAGGLLAERHLTLKGLVAVGAGVDLRDTLETLKGAHAPGIVQAFYLHSDRYINAEVEGITNVSYGALANLQTPFDIDFVASDPYWYSVNTTTTTGLASGGTVTAAGTAPGAPLWTLVVSSIGTAGTVTITNTTTGEAIVLTPPATGTYLINSLLETVTKSGVDESAYVSGIFPSLAVGANTITVGLTGSATVSALTAAFQARYF